MSTVRKLEEHLSRPAVREQLGLAGQPARPDLPDDTRRLLMTTRQAIIMVLGALEEYLELPRSIEPRHKRGS